MTDSNYRPEIDGLRSIAVLSVLFYHVGFAWMPGGYIGVDVFFVISGYLITRLIESEYRATGSFNFSRFYVRRIRRLFPALFSTIAITFIAAIEFLPPNPFAQFCGSVVTSILSVSNFYFWNQGGYFAAPSAFMPLLHTWSLSVEEQFYLIWPVLLVIALRWRIAAPLVVAALLLGSLLLSVVYIDDRSSIYYLLPFRAFELAIGASVLWLERYRLGKSFDTVAQTAGLAVIGWTVLTYTDRTIFPSYGALPPCVGAAMIIYAGRAPWVSALLTNPLTVGIGLASYSLYLVHWPIIVFYKYQQFVPLSEVQKWAVCLAALAVAGLSYWFVERPFRHEQSNSKFRGWRFAVASVLSASVVVTPAATAWATGGWKWRYPGEMAVFFDNEVPKYPLVCFSPVTFLPKKDPRCYRIAESGGPNLTCFKSSLTMQPEETDPHCYRTVENGKPNILLLGDSTVAHLLPGLYAQLGNKANLYLWAASACPGIPNFDTVTFPPCRKINDYFFSNVFFNNRYDLVILSNFGQFDQIKPRFKETIAMMDRAKVPFVLIGQTISFYDSVANLAARHGRIAGLEDYVGSALWLGCSEEYGLDKLVDEGNFFSMQKALCRNGLPVFRQGGQLLFTDSTHLSRRGSIFVADQLIPWLKVRGYLEMSHGRARGGG